MFCFVCHGVLLRPQKKSARLAGSQDSFRIVFNHQHKNNTSTDCSQAVIASHTALITLFTRAGPDRSTAPLPMQRVCKVAYMGSQLETKQCKRTSSLFSPQRSLRPRVKLTESSAASNGWKVAKGAPVRLELGPKRTGKKCCFMHV